jgi:hypothetical protein
MADADNAWEVSSLQNASTRNLVRIPRSIYRHWQMNVGISVRGPTYSSTVMYVLVRALAMLALTRTRLIIWKSLSEPKDAFHAYGDRT